MQQRTIIIGLATLISGTGLSLFRFEWLSVNATVNELALVLVSAF